MPDADHDEAHEDDGAVVAEDVDEDLEDGLCVGGADGVVEVLDAEEEAEEDEEAEEGGEADGGDDSDRGAPGGFAGFFGKMG